MIRRLASVLALASIMLLVVLAYFPGLHGPYVLDDGENITLNRAVAIRDLSPSSLYQALTSNESGPLKRPIAALSFALNHYFADGFDNTFPYKLVNLAIHLINTLLAYFLVTLLLRTPALHSTWNPVSERVAGGIIAAIWALHPLQLTSVLYVVQRMNSLSAMFVLGGLIVFCHGRLRLEQGEGKGLPTMYTGVAIGTLLGLGAKENAVLLPFLAFVIEYTLFRNGRRAHTFRRPIRMFYLITVLAPTAATVIYLLLHPEFIFAGYAERHFSPMERLLTQSRILWFYLSLILFPATHRLGLFHDDVRLSHGLFDPLTTLPAVISIAALIWLAVTRAMRYPVPAFGILWFLMGHALESTVLPLEIAYEHRNYLPSLGIVFFLVLAAWNPIKNNVRTPRFAALISSVVILVLGFTTWSRSNTWSDIRYLADDSARHHPTSPRANDFAARVALNQEGDINKAILFVMTGARVATYEAGFHIDMRLLLSILSSEINASLAEKSIAPPKVTAGLKIKGIPEGIGSTVDRGRLILTYEPSGSETVSRLLRERPISVHAIVSIENLTRCLLEKPHLCDSLRLEALEWLTVAGENPRTSSDYRALILGNAARIYASLNDHQRAYQYIERAADLAPNELSYQLGRIEYLIRLGRLEKARDLLDTYGARQENPDTGVASNRHTILRLEEMYKSATINKKTGPGNL